MPDDPESSQAKPQEDALPNQDQGTEAVSPGLGAGQQEPEPGSTGKAQPPHDPEHDPYVIRDPNDPGNYPTLWQRKMMWACMTGLSILAIGAMAVFVIGLASWLLAFFQPLLLPFAVAAVLAYLLYPLVQRLHRNGMDEQQAGSVVFFGFIIASGLLITAMAVPLSQQVENVIRNGGEMVDRFEEVIDRNLSAQSIEEHRSKILDTPILGDLVKMTPFVDAPAEEETEAEQAQIDEMLLAPGIGTWAAAGKDTEQADELSAETQQELASIRSWLLGQLPEIGKNFMAFLRKSVGGFLGVFGFLLGFILTPIYLFFFLRESSAIKKNWSDYVPLRASPFKQEVVDLLQEINGYLIAFFRGQLIVSIVDGILTAIILSLLGVKFALLLGVMVATIGVIPYLGVIICFVPALIIATVQGAQGGWYIAPDAPWWVLPIVVTAAWLAIQNIDGYFLAPKIVGDAVGLHPLTVIVSVFFWGTILGGLLGAILAVPLTATIKVLFRRYIWQRQKVPNPKARIPRSPDGSEQGEDIGAGGSSGGLIHTP